ncbi:ly6/PLAUR domain-containing protein 2-like [Leptodactylus fuscus]|uniref:ly6/PLAUR domain-containing protein 2-like n=1 Tax=Leptodactylus fuscus TaxID=238119 RepID=UPI003F4F2DA3
MNIFGIVLVVLTLCSLPGESLVCYYCPDETLSSECTDQKNCTASDSMCKTTVLSPDIPFPFQGNEVVIRGCSTIRDCDPTEEDELGNIRKVFCCNVELCNNRGLNATTSYAADKSSMTLGIILLGISVPLIVMWQ